MAAKRAQKQVQRQFADKAQAYAESAIHARGASLGRLLQLLEPAPEWVVLDVGTGAGHTAHLLAPHVQRVVATDVTPSMLQQARSKPGGRDGAPLLLAVADAENLPFAEDAFDLLTCRLAAHHFPHPASFMAEAARVLRPGGLLALVDNVVPGSRLRGKKGRLQRAAGRYVNAVEQLRDPSHQRCLSIHEWRDAFYGAGFAIEAEEVATKELDFHDWVGRMQVAPEDRVRLEAMLRQAPREALEFLTPIFAGGTISFHLSEALIVGRLET